MCLLSKKIIVVSVFVLGAVFTNMTRAKAEKHDGTVIVNQSEIILPVTGSEPGSIRIFLDDVIADSYADISPEQIVFRLPFTLSTEKFTIKVENIKTGKTLYSNDYRIEDISLFQNIEGNFSYQQDNSAVLARINKPQNGVDNGGYLAQDFRAGADIVSRLGKWKVGFSGEMVGTTRNANKLNTDGPKIDLASGQGFINFQGNTTRLGVQMGDVDFQANNSLVSTGYRTRGVNVKSDFLNEKITLNTGLAYGNDIRGFRKGVVGYRENNNRIDVRLDATAMSTDWVKMRVHSSFLQSRRPDDANFGVAQVASGEENSVRGVGVNFDLWEDRVRLGAEKAWSTFESPAGLNNNFGGASVSVSEKQGQAEKFFMEADVLRGLDWATFNGSPVSLRLIGDYQRVDSNFNSIQSFVSADQEATNIRLNGQIGIVDLTLGHSRIENNLLGSNSVLTNLLTTYSSNITVQLEDYRSSRPLIAGGRPDEEGAVFTVSQLIPSSVSLGGDKQRIAPRNRDAYIAASGIDAAFVAKQVTKNFNARLNWNWDQASTNFTFRKTLLDSQQKGAETADRDDITFELDQSFYQNNWDVSLRGMFGWAKNKENSTKSEETKYGFGVSGNLRMKNFPDLTGTADLTWDKANFQSDNSSSLSTFWRLSGGLDFTKFLPGILNNDMFSTNGGPVKDTYARLLGQVQEQDTRDPNFDRTGQYNYSVIAQFGFRL